MEETPTLASLRNDNRMLKDNAQQLSNRIKLLIKEEQKARKQIMQDRSKLKQIMSRKNQSPLRRIDMQVNKEQAEETQRRMIAEVKEKRFFDKNIRKNDQLRQRRNKAQEVRLMHVSNRVALEKIETSHQLAKLKKHNFVKSMKKNASQNVLDFNRKKQIQFRQASLGKLDKVSNNLATEEGKLSNLEMQEMQMIQALKNTQAKYADAQAQLESLRN